MSAKQKETFFPWMEDIVKCFAKSFMVDYDIDTLSFLHRSIDEEIKYIYTSNDYTVTRTKALYHELTNLYEHMRLKINQHPDFANTTLSCVKLLSQIIKTGLILTQGLIKSEWIERTLTAIKLFTGKRDLVYDSLLLVNGLKKIYHKPYSLILKCVLTEDSQENITDPLVYMVVILLFRRLRALVFSKSKEHHTILATKIKPPSNLISWLASLDANDSSPFLKNLKHKKIAIQLMKRNLPESVLKKIRNMALNSYYFGSSSNDSKGREIEEHLDMFIIDTSSTREFRNKEEQAGSSEVSAIKKDNSLSKRKRKKPSFNKKNITKDIKNKASASKTDISVSYINNYSNLVVEDDLQSNHEKDVSDAYINESDLEIDNSESPLRNIDEPTMKSKKKSKSKTIHTVQNNRMKTCAMQSRHVSGCDSVVDESDNISTKKPKNKYDNLSGLNISPKRIYSEDTDTVKDVARKDTNSNRKKLKSTLRNERIKPDKVMYGDSNVASPSVKPIHLLASENQKSMVNVQNSSSIIDNDIICIAEIHKNKSDEKISKSKTQTHLNSMSAVPSTSKKRDSKLVQNEDSEITDNKNIYFKKLMLKKATSVAGMSPGNNANDGEALNLEVTTEENSEIAKITENGKKLSKILNKSTVPNSSPECITSQNAVLDVSADNPAMKMNNSENISDSDFVGSSYTSDVSKDMQASLEKENNISAQLPSANENSVKPGVSVESLTLDKNEKENSNETNQNTQSSATDALTTQLMAEISNLKSVIGNLARYKDSDFLHMQNDTGDIELSKRSREQSAKNTSSNSIPLMTLYSKTPNISNINEGGLFKENVCHKQCEVSNTSDSVVVTFTHDSSAEQSLQSSDKTTNKSVNASDIQSPSTASKRVDDAFECGRDFSHFSMEKTTNSSVIENVKMNLTDRSQKDISATSDNLNSIELKDKSVINEDSNVILPLKSTVQETIITDEELNVVNVETSVNNSAINESETSNVELGIAGKSTNLNKTSYEEDKITEDINLHSLEPQKNDYVTEDISCDKSVLNIPNLVTSHISEGNDSISSSVLSPIEREVCESLCNLSENNCIISTSLESELLQEPGIECENKEVLPNLSSTFKLANDSMLTNVSDSENKSMHVDCTVSSPKDVSWDKMKVNVNSTNSKIKIDINVKASENCESESKSTETPNVESKLPLESTDKTSEDMDMSSEDILVSRDALNKNQIAGKCDILSTNCNLSSEMLNSASEILDSGVKHSKDLSVKLSSQDIVEIDTQSKDVENNIQPCKEINAKSETSLEDLHPDSITTNNIHIENSPSSDIPKDSEEKISEKNIPPVDKISPEKNLSKSVSTSEASVCKNSYLHGVNLLDDKSHTKKYPNTASESNESLVQLQNDNKTACVNDEMETDLSIVKNMPQNQSASLTDTSDSVNHMISTYKKNQCTEQLSVESQIDHRGTLVDITNSSPLKQIVEVSSPSSCLTQSNINKPENEIIVNEEFLETKKQTLVQKENISYINQLSKINDSVHSMENSTANKNHKSLISVDSPAAATVNSNEFYLSCTKDVLLGDGSQYSSENGYLQREFIPKTNDSNHVLEDSISETIKKSLEDLIDKVSHEITLSGNSKDVLPSNNGSKSKNSNLRNELVATINDPKKSTEKCINETEKMNHEIVINKDSNKAATVNSNEFILSSPKVLPTNDINKHSCENDNTKIGFISDSIINVSKNDPQFVTENVNKSSGEIKPKYNDTCKQDTKESLLKLSSNVLESEYVPFCENKNYASFSDISLKNKDKNMNVDLGLKSPVKITNFSSAASTEIFSMYRNDLFRDDDKSDTTLFSKDDNLPNCLETDEINSQTLSCDVSDEDFDSKMNSSEEEEENINDTERASKNCQISIENDNSSALSKNDDISDSKNELNDKSNYCLIDKNVNTSSSNTTNNVEPVKEVLTRQSLRLKNKTETQSKSNSETDCSKTKNTSQKELKSNADVVDDKSNESEDSVSNSKISPAAEDVPDLPKTSDDKKNSVSSQKSVSKKKPTVTKSKLKDNIVDCSTPSKGYSLRHSKSSRRKDDSANLGIDLNKLQLDTPSCRSTRSKRESKFVKLLTSNINVQTNSGDLIAKQETYSSTAKSDEDSVQNTPSYNLRNRKSIIAPAKLKI